MPRKKRGSNWNTRKFRDSAGRIRKKYPKATVPTQILAMDVDGAAPDFTNAMMAAETTATKEVAAIAEPVLFDKFQNGDDEDDKSSDEESFHLPIDDEEAEKRDITLNGKGETEDDILDKFDSADGTPDEDLEEDKLLDEAEDVVDKVNHVSEMNGTTNGDSNDKVSEIDKVDNEQNGDELGDKTLINEESKDKEEQNGTEKTESQINGEDGGLEQEDVDMADIGEVKTEEIDIKDVDVNLEEALLNGVDEDEDVDLGKVKEDEDLVEEKLEQDVKVEEEAINTADVDEEAANIEECLDTVDKENEQDQEETVNKDEGIVSQVEEPVNQDKEILDKEGETVNNEDGGVEGTSKLMEDPPETFEDDEMMEDTPDLVENIQKLVDAPGLLEDDTTNTKEDTANLEKETSKTNLEEETTNLDDLALRAEESITIMDDEEINKDSEEPVKDKSEENSNHSGKSNDQDTDDLLNVSIIRGVEEDDENAREELTKDKELQDAEDESCDKVSVSDSADNEPKDDSRMDFEDDDSKQTEDEATMVEKGDDTLTEKDDSSKIDDEESKGSESKDDDKHCDSGKENENPDDDDEDDDLDNDDGGDYEPESGDDSSKEGSIKSGKRSLSSAEDDVATKKRKLEDQSAAKVPDPPAEPVKEDPKILTSFATFMKDKKLKNKLTRADLEQFCLQKICESILHKTDVGELHQKLKNYESTIDSLRKDVSQLTKQARDLEIVNKKLMNELKLQNGNKKPMVPLKITRSVGLQVKLNVSVAENLRRRPGPPVQMPKQVQAAANANNRAPVRPNAPAARPMPQKTPILNQALQNRRTTQQTSTTPQKRPNFSTIRPKGASVIDLTDEDDRAKAKQTPKTVSLSPMKTVTVSQNKTINVGGNKTITVNQTKTIPLTQQKPGTPNRTMATGVRLTPTQLKNGSIAIPASVVGSSSPQLMYVVQPTSTLASGGLMSTGTGPQKAVLVNFQPTNGVLTSSLNGSSVSVIPKGGLQLKTMNTRKHPAPLPAPPVVRINADGPVKPVPPKPHLSIRKTENGIILQWKMPYNLDHYETIASYQLYAYQETNAPPSTDMWRRVGDVKALALPMACTLTQFADKNKYYFAVRSVDIYKRIGAFSDPEEISL